MPQPLSGSTNPLGQFTDEFKDQAKPLVEPKKILEQILGSAGKKTDNQSSLETDPSAQAADDPQAQALKQQAQYQQKVQAANEKNQAKIRLFQQRLREELEFHEASKQKEQVEEQKEEREEEEKKNNEVIQLQHERQQEDTQLAERQGSKEAKAWGAG